jgi:hypothetical protein
LQRVVDLAASGADLSECLIVEIFCRTSRVTACLKQLGLKGCFGVGKLRSKNAMSSVIIADLTTPQRGEAFDELATKRQRYWSVFGSTMWLGKSCPPDPFEEEKIWRKQTWAPSTQVR